MIVLTDIPSPIRVGPFPIHFVIVNELESASTQTWGLFSSMTGTIKLQSQFPSVAKMLDTVMHEVLHAIWFAYDLPDQVQEEDAVSRIASGFLKFLMDNPEFCHWIATYVDEA